MSFNITRKPRQHYLSTDCDYPFSEINYYQRSSLFLAKFVVLESILSTVEARLDYVSQTIPKVLQILFACRSRERLLFCNVSYY